MLSNNRVVWFCKKLGVPFFRAFGATEDELETILDEKEGPVKYNIELSQLFIGSSFLMVGILFIPSAIAYFVLGSLGMVFLGSFIFWGIFVSFSALGCIALIKNTLLRTYENDKDVMKFERYIYCMNDIDFIVAFLIGVTIAFFVS